MSPAPGRIGEPDAGVPRRSRQPRQGRQGREVRAALERAGAFLSAQDLYAALREAGRPVGLSTVYRCLHDLLDGGAVDLVVSESGEALYRCREAGEHHHFLVCRCCGTAVEIGSPAIEDWLAAVGREHGYDRLAHRVEIFGRCTRCRGQRAAGGIAG